MKKIILKTSVFILTFMATILITGRFMNRGNNDMTMKMGAATLPVITFLQGDVTVNALYGHTAKMDVSSMASHLIQLGEEREFSFIVDTFGSVVSKILLEIRDCSGERLIEQQELGGYEQPSGFQQQVDHIRIDAAWKDLLEKDTEYAMVIILTDAEDRQIRYYTRCIWGTEVYAAEKVAFVKDFHEKTFDKEIAGELTKYLESNSTGDNTTLHKVNIHSSFSQVTWGELQVEPVTEPIIDILELGRDTGSFLLKRMVSSGSGKERAYYNVEEYYRIRYTASRVYLLDFERTMTQLPMVEGNIYGNDKIMLGIAGTDIQLAESIDGNFLAFVFEGRLCGYDMNDNKLSLLYSFYDAENRDARTLNRAHEMKILDVDDEGNVKFAVYGYFNRGRHEGETGIGVFRFDSTWNAIEEMAYIPYNKSWDMLRCDLEKLLYLNQNDVLYLYLDQRVYEIDIPNGIQTELVLLDADDNMHVSDDHRILLWNQGTSLQVSDLEAEKKNQVKVNDGEILRALNFIGDDIIYGVIRQTDIVEDAAGRDILPMYRIVICDAEGKLLKEYKEDNVYILSVDVVDNQINLNRVKKTEEGTYVETTPEHILNNEEQRTGQNKLVTVAVDVYETITQIQVKNTIDVKTIQILTPKEVLFEGSRDVTLFADAESDERGEKSEGEDFVLQKQYCVYNRNGVDEIYFEPARAVSLAYETSGRVVDETGKTVWFKGNRVSRNQIMAITEPDKTSKEASLAVCLDTMLKFNGITVQSAQMLEEGKDVLEILQSGLISAKVADLSGCPMDAMLYFVNQDVPVLAILADGEAILITGFNEYNVVIFEPSSGKLYKKGMKDSTKWFEENGNRFITYFG